VLPVTPVNLIHSFWLQSVRYILQAVTVGGVATYIIVSVEENFCDRVDAYQLSNV
jgi:hypothetical protein